MHLLCYWPDDCAALADFSAMMAERRLTAMLQSCKELEAICPLFGAGGGLPQQSFLHKVIFAGGTGFVQHQHVKAAL